MKSFDMLLNVNKEKPKYDDEMVQFVHYNIILTFQKHEKYVGSCCSKSRIRL